MWKTVSGGHGVFRSTWLRVTAFWLSAIFLWSILGFGKIDRTSEGLSAGLELFVGSFIELSDPCGGGRGGGRLSRTFGLTVCEACRLMLACRHNLRWAPVPNEGEFSSLCQNLRHSPFVRGNMYMVAHVKCIGTNKCPEWMNWTVEPVYIICFRTCRS